MEHGREYLRVVYAAAVGIAILTPVQAQDGGGASVDLTYGTLLSYEDGETSLRSELGLSVSSRTRTQTLTFSAGTSVDILSSEGSEGDLKDPYASLGYQLERRDTLLDIQANYRRGDIDDLQILDVIGEDPLVIAGGERESASARLRLELGRTAPFGATLSLLHAENTFRDVVFSPGLQDSVRSDASLRFRFNLNPTTTAFTEVSTSDIDRDGGTDTTRDRVSAGIDLEVNPALRIGAEVGGVRVVTEAPDAARNIQEGLFLRFNLAADRPNGVITASLLSDVGESGQRSTFRLTRQLELPRGRLSAGLGVGFDEVSDEFRPLYNLDYVHNLPRGQISAGLSQSFSTSVDGSDTLDSRLQLGLRQNLSELSSLSASVSYSESNQLDAGGADANQIRLSLDYNRTLTDDWSLVSGLTYIRQSGDGRSDRTDERIFLGLRSSLGWRP